jgi:hypothetical protein
MQAALPQVHVACEMFVHEKPASILMMIKVIDKMDALIVPTGFSTASKADRRCLGERAKRANLRRSSRSAVTHSVNGVAVGFALARVVCGMLREVPTMADAPAHGASAGNSHPGA